MQIHGQHCDEVAVDELASWAKSAIADLIPLQKGGTSSPWSGVKRDVEHCRTMFDMYTLWSMCICIR